MRFVAAIRRRAPALLATAGFLAGALSLSDGRAAEEAAWQTDLATAAKLARKQEQPLLIHFYATWCQPCQRMERETFAATDFGKQIAGRFVLVRIDSDRHPELIRKYGVTGLPCDVFVSPNGRILSRNAGYLQKRQYFAQLARWESRFVKRSKVRIAAAKPQPDDISKSTGKAQTAKPGPVLIGMDGYSPVAMHQRRKWVTGKKEFAWPQHGISYWMADADELAAFQRDPGRFAPKLLGCDPVILNETDRALPGKVQYGAIFDGELFFFTTAESRTKFRENPTQYTRTRHVLRVDDIYGAVRR
jgi:thioredoxin-related protein/YHS domain-containing protein